MKHTPGPWKAATNNSGHTIRGKNGKAIATITWMMTNRNWAEAAANAQLIAVAPALLENLKDLVDCIRKFKFGDYSPLMDEIFDAEAVIREAEGKK